MRGAEDARQIARKSLEADQGSERLRRQYTYRVLERRTEGGQVHSTLKEVVYLAGRPHERLLQRDGKAISAEEDKKEQERIDRALAQVLKLSPAELKKRTEDAIARDSRRYMIRPAAADAFDLRMDGERELAGRPSWQIHIKSRTGVKGPVSLLPKVEGTVWIDKADLAWARVDVTTTEPYSLGLLFLRMGKGSRLVFENMKINDELWATRRVDLAASVRLVLKKGPDENESLYSDYRKFSSDSRLVGAEETPECRCVLPVNTGKVRMQCYTTFRWVLKIHTF